MERELKITAGRVFLCPICGAEVSVLLYRSGDLAPVCCNQPMKLTNRTSPIYYCPSCGAEIMVTKEGKGNLTPRCCNRTMVIRQAAA